MTPTKKGVHVLAGSYEYDRIVEPLFGEYPVEKIIVLKSDTSYPKMTEISNQFIQKLEDNIPKEIETLTLDIYDFDEVFQKTLEIFRELSEDNKPIFLNISTAPKLTLVAMISAAFFFRNRGDIEIFYVAPQKYLIPEILDELDNIDEENKEKTIENLKNLQETFRKSGIAVNTSRFEVVPLFPIEGINELDLEVLEILAKTQSVDSISNLTERLQTKNNEEVKRTSVQYRLKKLKEKGLITSNRVDRRMEIKITRLGEIYLKSYKEVD